MNFKNSNKDLSVKELQQMAFKAKGSKKLIRKMVCKLKNKKRPEVKI